MQDRIQQEKRSTQEIRLAKAFNEMRILVSNIPEKNDKRVTLPVRKTVS